MRALLAAGLAASLAACSTAHMTDPHHTWTPMTASARRKAAEKGETLPGWRAAGWELLDALTMPFHGLGHVFGQGARAD